MEEPRKTRIELIQKIEEERKSRVVVYFCGDRAVARSRIANDAIRPLYDHLLAVSSSSKVKNLDLFLYSVGGVVEAPWRIVTMLREFCDRLNVIVPYKAYSATTLIALGADKIVMGRKGELSPIDPTLQLIVTGPKTAPVPSEIPVEDISSYITFIKDVAGLTDQNALAQSINILAEKLTPAVLGSAQRAHSHIRIVARKLLSLCQPPMEERRITTIVQALTEKMYAHGHGIGRREAKEAGLPISEPSSKLEELIWNLYLAYEELLKLGTTRDPEGYFGSDAEDEYREDDVAVAYIESTEKLHVFKGNLRIKRIREMPPQLSVNVNLPIQLPPNVPPQAIPQNVQQTLQQMLQQAATGIRDQVAREIIRQAPVVGIKCKLIGCRWLEIS